jgi:hypothetical protein
MLSLYEANQTVILYQRYDTRCVLHFFQVLIIVIISYISYLTYIYSLARGWDNAFWGLFYLQYNNLIMILRLILILNIDSRNRFIRHRRFYTSPKKFWLCKKGPKHVRFTWYRLPNTTVYPFLITFEGTLLISFFLKLNTCSYILYIHTS